MLKKFSDRVIGIAGLAGVSSGLGLVFVSSVFPHAYTIIASVIIITLGEGLFEPSLNGSLSKSVGDHEQGKLQGVNQSLQSLYRVLVPLGAAAVYLYSPAILYLLAMFIALGALLLFTRLKTASAVS